MTTWDAARYRQQQTPRKYKPCGPVGPTPVQLEGMKWDRAIAVTRKMMADRPDFDAVICCPQDTERLKVLGLRLIPHVYARKGEWSLYATPKEPWQRSPVLGHLDSIPATAWPRTIVYETSAGKLAVVGDPKHVGPPRFVYPHSATCSCVDCAQRRGS